VPWGGASLNPENDWYACRCCEVAVCYLPPVAPAAFAGLFLASIALTELTNDFSKTLLSTVPSTKPSNRPLVLAVAYDNHIDVSRTVRPAREIVGVAGRASPNVGVGRLQDDVVGTGQL